VPRAFKRPRDILRKISFFIQQCFLFFFSVCDCFEFLRANYENDEEKDEERNDDSSTEEAPPRPHAQIFPPPPSPSPSTFSPHNFVSRREKWRERQKKKKENRDIKSNNTRVVGEMMNKMLFVISTKR
jgi:hypothetical protein